jgi:CBS domain containing-hemolysin-like protein
MAARDLLTEEKYFKHSRMPLMRSEGCTPVGILHLADIAESMRRQELDRTLIDFRRPIGLAGTSFSVAQACDEMVRYNDDLVCIVDDGRTFTGLVTMNDVLDRLIEEPPPEDSEARPVQ